MEQQLFRCRMRDELFSMHSMEVLSIYKYMYVTFKTGTVDRIYFNLNFQYLSVIWPPDFSTVWVYLYNIAVDTYLSTQCVLALFCQLLNEKWFIVEKYKIIINQHKIMHTTNVFRWSIVIILTWPQISSEPRSKRIGIISRNLSWLFSLRCNKAWP